jgi:hypothetical protein
VNKAEQQNIHSMVRTFVVITFSLPIFSNRGIGFISILAVIRWNSPSTNRDISVNSSLQDPKAYVIVAPTDGDIHTFICDSGGDRDEWLSKITHTVQEWCSGYHAIHNTRTEVNIRKTGTISKVSIPHTVPVAGPKVSCLKPSGCLW